MAYNSIGISILKLKINETSSHHAYIKIWCDVNLLLFDPFFIIHVQTLYRSNNPCFSAYVPNSGGIRSGLFV
jgi:hypothetical protein